MWKQHGEEAYTQYSSEVNTTYTELSKKIREKYSNFQFGDNRLIQILEYTEGGRVKTIQIGNINLSGVELRGILGLKSANFEVITQGENITFKVTGYGHGVRNESNRSRCSSKTGLQLSGNYKTLLYRSGNCKYKINYIVGAGPVSAH